MQRFIRALAGLALVSSLAACVVTQPQAPAPHPDAHEIAVQRLKQVDGRADNLSRRIDNHVNQATTRPRKVAHCITAST